MKNEQTETVYIIHDNDLDGEMAMALYLLWCQSNYTSYDNAFEITAIEVGHGIDFTSLNIEELIPKDALLVIIDHEVTKALADRCLQHVEHLTVYDHHPKTKELLDAFDSFNDRLSLSFGEKNASSTALVSKLFHGHLEPSIAQLAEAVNIHDCWLFDDIDQYEHRSHGTYVSAGYAKSFCDLDFFTVSTGKVNRLIAKALASMFFNGQLGIGRKHDLIQLVSPTSKVVRGKIAGFSSFTTTFAPYVEDVERTKEAQRLFINAFEVAKHTVNLELAKAKSIATKNTVVMRKVIDGKSYTFGLAMSADLINDVGSSILEIYPGVDFAVIIYVKGSSLLPYKVCFRSNDSRTEVTSIAAVYGGGGHRNASACQLSADDFVRFITETVEYPNLSLPKDAYVG